MSAETDRIVTQLRTDYPDDLDAAGGATPEEVAAAEARLGVTLPPSNRVRKARYGTLGIGPAEIYGITRADRTRGMGGGGVPSAIGVTLRRRTDAGLPPALVVVQDLDGDELVCIDTASAGLSGEAPVVRWVLAEQAPRAWAASFNDFLLHQLQAFEP